MTDTTTPAGWYPAPQEPGLQRYWDGATWGDERRPAAPEAVQVRPNGLVIAGFVFAIFAALITPLGGGALPGLLALILEGIGGRRGRTGLGIAATVVAAIAIVFSLLILAARVANSSP